ncbi:MAG: diguanylate cyclase [Steroidobacteraceae bacterium]|nr:diguanylate cyclase [Steroidobacteraceae bacterium]MDW8259847.1 diguanylate cyclase [Gammaproteobacteria bacterium]
MQFDAGLEREYQIQHLRDVRVRVLVGLLAAVAVGFTSSLTAGSGPASVDPALDIVRFGILWPSIVLLGLIGVVEAWFRRAWLWAAPVLLGVLGAGGAYIAAMLVAGGDPHAFTTLIILLLVACLALGLLFWQVLVLSVTLTVTYVAVRLGVDARIDSLRIETLQLVLVCALGTLLAYALEFGWRRNFLNTRLLEEVGARDAMTGLWNRRSFDQHLERLWKQGLRDQQSVSLLLLDVDFFKAYNDCNGHQAGDECLRRLAALLRRFERRPLDMVARFGGEEFAILMYQVPREHIDALAAELTRAVAEAKMPHGASTVSDYVTVSVGVGSLIPRPGRTAEALVRLADASLYDAKNSGRGRVVLREYNVVEPDSLATFRALRTGS